MSALLLVCFSLLFVFGFILFVGLYDFYNNNYKPVFGLVDLNLYDSFSSDCTVMKEIV